MEVGAKMIVVRRIFAVMLVGVLVLAFGFSLAISRVTGTVMSSDFYVTQLRELDAYEVVHDEVLPRAVDDFLRKQNEKLPDNLSSIALPTDPASERAILDLLRVAFPPEVMQAETEQAVDQIVPYLTGAHDQFDVRIRLGDELKAVAGHEPGQLSRLEQTWRTLNLAEATLGGLVEASASAGGAADSSANGDQPPGLLDIVGGDVAGASAWLETELFGAIDELVPYLTGDAPHVHAVVRFDAYPALAGPFANALHRTPEELLTTGFVIDDQEINAELAKSGRSEINTSDNALAIFRPEGYLFTQQQILDRQASATDGGTGNDGPAIDDLRTWGSRIRLARWGALLLVVLLVAGIGALGGRRWQTRIAWAASALLAASVVAFVIAGPIYGRTAGSALERSIAEQRAEDGGTWQPLRDRVLDRAESVIDGMAGRAAATARNWAILSVLTLGGTVAWSEYERRRPLRAPAEAQTTVPPPPSAPPV